MLRRMALSFVLAAMFVTTAHSHDQGNPSTPAQASHLERIRVDGDVEAAQLAHKVEPEYPPIARAANVSGTVVLHAVVAKDGSVQDLDIVSGPPLLLKAAMEAVKQWRYRSTLLNGQPVEVDTTISVPFTSDGFVGNSLLSPPEIDPHFREDVEQLLDAIGFQETTAKAARESFESNRSTISKALPDTPNKNKILDAYREKLVALTQSQDFEDRVVSVYEKYLTDNDVKAITQFYESNAGQHFSAAESDMNNDLGQAGIELGRERITGILKELCDEYAELQGKAKFCTPPGNSSRSSDIPAE